ncbi:hypothetical protein CRX72_17250 [Pantoea sp. BRM17]|nr:hypothetical protein CRX72_17250 [Pantoea sp. BRM17]
MTEATGEYNRAITLSTNATVLEALLFKTHMKPLIDSRNSENRQFFRQQLADPFRVPQRCLPVTAPLAVNDTIFANGYAWNTLTDDNKWVPTLAQISTRAVFGLWALWDTPFTDALMRTTRLQYDPARGWYEGRPAALTTLPWVLSGMEYGWQLPGADRAQIRQQRQRASLVYQVQERRWQRQGILTARSDFALNVAPWHLSAGMWQQQQMRIQPEGRLGDSEYSAAGFGLWGFANQQSLQPPAQHVIIDGLALDIDSRDPRTTWTLLYNSRTLSMVGYSNTPQVIGWSSRDMARLMMALQVVATFHPQYGEYLQRIILRWNFCPVVDKQGQSEANSGLVSGSDRRPVVSLWQMGDTLIALTAARELQLIDDRRFDHQLSQLLGSLNRLPLTQSGVPKPKTLVRITGLVVALLLALGAWLLLRHEGDGWRWLVNGGWHTTARTGALTPEEQRWAAVAWRYFENNGKAPGRSV